MPRSPDAGIFSPVEISTAAVTLPVVQQGERSMIRTRAIRTRTRSRTLPLLLAIMTLLAVGVSNVSPLGTSAKAVDVGDYSGATNSNPVWLVKPTDHFSDGETPETFQGPVGRADCGPGSNPETSDVQGSVSVGDRMSGRSSEGYTCNMEQVGNYGPHSPLPFEGAEWQ